MAETQLQLPLDFAPELVRGHGLRAAHPRPLVSMGKAPGRAFTSYRVSPSRAWSFPEIELARAGSSIAALVLDCDNPKAMAMGMADLPEPNWTTWRTSNHHAHPAWALETPVHQYPQARIRPLQHLARIGDFYTQAVGADPGYAGVLSHNPCPRYRDTVFTTTWGREAPYTLSQLAEVIPFGWSAPTVRQTGVGRNADLFESGMRWAGKRTNMELEVLPALMVANQQFTHPLPLSEVQATARSIEKYRARWAARGGHSRRWKEKQSARGRRSGEVRRVGSAEATRPWEAEGISRRTWYRRRAAERAASTEGGIDDRLPRRQGG